VPQDFPTIQQAINSLEAQQVIRVDARRGPYLENLVIDEFGIKLESIRGRAEIQSPSGQDPVVAIRASGTEIHGFLITGGSTGVVVEHATGVVISNNEITNNLQGVGLIEASGVRITSNEIIENGSIGVLLQKSGTIQVVGNTISKNPIGGIFFEQNSVENLIEGNVIQESDMGVRLMTSPRNRFLGNKISHNSTFGVSIESSEDILVQGNEVLQCGIGIDSVNGLGLHLIRNRIAENGTGVNLHGSVRRNVIRENSFIANSQFALRNTASYEIDATHNYWGSESGPVLIDAESSESIENAIRGEILFAPWLTESLHSESE